MSPQAGSAVTTHLMIRNNHQLLRKVETHNLSVLFYKYRLLVQSFRGDDELSRGKELAHHHLGTTSAPIQALADRSDSPSSVAKHLFVQPMLALYHFLLTNHRGAERTKCVPLTQMHPRAKNRPTKVTRTLLA